VRPALGTFTHEAVAVDPATGQLYLTEDLPDGRWYRFTPDHVSLEGRADLDRGQLEAAVVDMTDGRVSWQAIPSPDGVPQPTRRQAHASTRFNGGEGCWCANDCVYFTTKGDDRVWLYDIRASRIRILYDGESPQGARSALHGVDNVTGARGGEVLVAEDNGDMQIVAIAADGNSAPILQIEGQDSSEIAGPAFDPSGTRLYFSSQRGSKGSNDGGLTYEVSGPFPL
jgi:secreted PhoX family phosphatase